MRWMIISSFLGLATAPLMAQCNPSYFRTLNATGEVELWTGQAGVVTWTNAVFPSRVKVEQTDNLLVSEPWNTFLLVPVTGAYSQVRLFDPSPPWGMTLIPGGLFVMGADVESYPEANANETPAHDVYVNELYIDRHEVTKALWDEIANWAVTNGYSFDQPGEGRAIDHPVHSVNWYDMVKWCNARSEKESRVPSYYTGPSFGPDSVYRSGQVDVLNDWVRWDTGYRLPTEAEWEKAARGGGEGVRFPWLDFTNKISHAKANYFGTPNEYDLSAGLHPDFANGDEPHTSPVGYFSPSGYCLADMAGNVWEWCWDRYDGEYYSQAAAINPIGPESGSSRVLRGGGWASGGVYCRVAYRDDVNPAAYANFIGFRCVLPVYHP